MYKLLFGNMSFKEYLIHVGLISILTAVYAYELFFNPCCTFNTLQKIIAIYLFFDIGGGVISNLSYPFIKHYLFPPLPDHSSQPRTHSITIFMLIHSMHLVLAAYLFFTPYKFNYEWFIYSFIGMMLPSLIINYVKLPASVPCKRLFVAFYAIIILKWHIIFYVPQLEWFIYLFTVKLICGGYLYQVAMRSEWNYIQDQEKK